jgi:hypothetical protein
MEKVDSITLGTRLDEEFGVGDDLVCLCHLGVISTTDEFRKQPGVDFGKDADCCSGVPNVPLSRSKDQSKECAVP